jgi:hypothetical protein
MMKKLFLIALCQIAYIGIAMGQSSPPKAVLSDIPTQESMNAWRVKEAEIRGRLDKICADERYKLFFAKTPCNVPDLTLQQLTDNSKATPAEKSVILQMDAEYLTIAQMAAENYKLNIKPESLGVALANHRMKGRSDSQENLSNLYQGKITWGAYNTQRKAIAVNGKAEFDKIVKDNTPQR